MNARRRTKLWVRVLSLVAVASVATGTSATAAMAAAEPTPAAATTHHTLSGTLDWLHGKRTSGPNSYTHGQYAVVAGTHALYTPQGCPTGKYALDLHLYSDHTLTDTGTQAATTPASGTQGQCPKVDPDSAADDDTVHPDGLNPFGWDWGHILGGTWSAIWDHCLEGSAEGLVGTASGSLIVNLLSRGGRVFVGPYGYAAIAIGGCFSKLLF